MTGTDRSIAPTIKAFPDTVTAAFDEFMGVFETFKDTNDRRLGEIESKLGTDVLTTEKLDRVNRAMDEQKRLLDEVLLKKARPAVGAPLERGEGGSHQSREYKAAFDAYVRRGDESGLRELEAKTYAGSVASDGGIVMPAELDTTIGRRIALISPMRRLATVRQVSTAVLKKPFASASLATGWAAEKDSRPQTGTQTLVELAFPTQELYAQPAATQALLDDAAVDIESWISSEVEIAFAEQEGTAFITGDGTNKPKGFMSVPVVADASWAWGSLGYIATGVVNAFKAANQSDSLVDLVYSLKAGYRQNGTFMMSRKTQGEVRKFKDTTGNYIWQPPTAAGMSASLLGFPVAESEDMPDFSAGGTPGATALAFGDFRAGYLIVDRIGTRMLRDPYSAKPYVLFYVTKRVGGGVQNFDAIKLLKFAAS